MEWWGWEGEGKGGGARRGMGCCEVQEKGDTLGC